MMVVVFQDLTLGLAGSTTLDSIAFCPNPFRRCNHGFVLLNQFGFMLTMYFQFLFQIPIHC